MLTSLFQHFTVLYQNLTQTYPLLASEHSLKQEQEVYDKSTKLTYRNVCPLPAIILIDAPIILIDVHCLGRHPMYSSVEKT